MKRFLIFAGLVGAAVYMFAPPRIAPLDRPEAVQSGQPASGTLRTSWGSTLQSLKEEPSRDIAFPRPKSPETEPDRLLVVGGADGDLVEWAKATLAAYRQASEPHAALRPGGPGPEMWVIGNTNGWVQGEDSAPDARGLPSYDYVAAIDDLNFVPAEPQPAARVAAIAKPDLPSPAAKPVVHTQDAIDVAGPYRPRGLFARKRDGQRGRGPFGLFGGRKTERPAWSAGPAG